MVMAVSLDKKIVRILLHYVSIQMVKSLPIYIQKWSADLNLKEKTVKIIKHHFVLQMSENRYFLESVIAMNEKCCKYTCAWKIYGLGENIDNHEWLHLDVRKGRFSTEKCP